MGIILKYMLRNLSEKKMRTFLIMLAITLSTGVFFASMAISDSMMQTFMKTIKGYYGNCDLVIWPSEESPSPYFYKAGAEKHMDILEYAIGELGTSAYYKPSKDEEVNMYLKGIDLEELNRMNPFTLSGQQGLYPFEGRKLVIASTTAEKYGIKLGDSINLEIGKGRFKFKVCGIAAPTGHFKGEGDQVSGVIPWGTMSSLIDAKGKFGTVYLKLKNPEQKQEAIDILSKEYSSYKVEEPFPYEMLEAQTRDISMVFMMLSSVVFFMSLFIVYSSFKVITAERLPVIGTFRSIGATGRGANFMLIGESLLYGCIGGVLGCGLGIGILSIMALVMEKMFNSGGGADFEAVIAFTPIQLGISLFAAIVLCIMGSIVPILRILKIPVKDIVLNFMQRPEGRKIWRLPLGLVLMGSAIGMSFIEADEMRMMIVCVSLLMSMSSLIMLVPYITELFVMIFQRLYSMLFGNIGILAAKNLRDNRNVLSSISMLVIGISSLLMINTAGYDSVVYINDMFNNTKYDIEVYYWKADRNFARLVRNVDGVSDVYGEYSFYRTEVENREEGIRELVGVDSTTFLDFFNLDMEGDPAEALKRLDEERSLLISETLQESLKVQVGEYIRLKTVTGSKSYKIIGVFKKVVTTGRSMALASSRFIRADMQAKQYSSVYVKAYKDPELVAETLREEFKRDYPYIETKEQMRKQYTEENKQSTMLMSGFSVLASIIGIFGILNNLMLGFIERKHSFSVFRSMGMSKRQLIAMIFVESATGGLIGGLIGIIGGIVLITMLAGAGNLAEIHYPIGAFVGYAIAGAIIMLTASISPAIRTSKLNIIDEIKFE